LEELPRIPSDDAIRWSRQEEVRKCVRSIGLDLQIRQIYRSRFAKEPEGAPRMEPLAQELILLLKEHS
jgi:hypothetical protein